MKLRKQPILACITLILAFIFATNQAFALLINKDTPAIEPEMSMAEISHENDNDETLIDESLVEFAEFFSRPRLVKLLKDSRKIILTFDDGPHPRTTPKILRILKNRNIRAVFFVLGLQAEKYPHLVKQIAEEGHEIGNHTYNHKNLAQLSEKQVMEQIERTNKIISSITGTRPRFLRPPYGAMNRQLIRLCQTSGMNIMLWTIDPKDWQNKNEAKILYNLDHQLGLNGNMRGGAVLLHDIYPATVRVLDPFLDKLSANEYRIADATNFTESDDSRYWASISPKLSRYGGFKRPVDVAILDHQLLSKLFSENAPPEISSMAMLKANRSNDLLIYLAQHN